MAEGVKYPATMVVHWPTGPVATILFDEVECANCLNSGPPEGDADKP